MKLTRFIYGVIAVVLVALIYVRQSVELLKVGYEVRSKEMMYIELLDQNKILTYNIEVLKSPKNLERFLKSTKLNYGVSNKRDIVELRRNDGQAKNSAGLANSGKKILVGLLSLRSQAEATTIK